MPKGGRIPVESLQLAKLKRLGRRRIDGDNQTGDCKWINIERREQKLNALPPALFLGLHQTSQRLRINSALRQRGKKADLAGCSYEVLLWIFSIYSLSGRITFFFLLFKSHGLRCRTLTFIFVTLHVPEHQLVLCYLRDIKGSVRHRNLLSATVPVAATH